MNKLLSNFGKFAIGVVAAKYLSTWVFGKFEIGSMSAKVQKVTFTNLRLLLNLPIKNNLGVTASIDGFVGELVYYAAGNNGYQEFPLAKVLIPNKVTFKAGEQVNVQTSILVEYDKLAGNIANLIASGALLGKIKIKGVLLAAKTRIPINQFIQVA
jgi:hypothetical protein